MMALEFGDNRPPAAIALACRNLRRDKLSSILVPSFHCTESITTIVSGSRLMGTAYEGHGVSRACEGT
jgi:hypothetical protein